MSPAISVTLDTSVLLNFIYAKLPGNLEEDQGSIQLLESEQSFCVIGGKAHSEFTALCDRRYELYEDLVDWLAENPDEDIYEYDPTSRGITTSSNDLSHIRFDVQHDWANDPRRKQLADMRRCMQDLAAYQEALPKEYLDEVFEQFENEELADELGGLGLRHDIEILVDAVEIHKREGIERLVAVDSDITAQQQIESINEAIRDIEGDEFCLLILHPEEVPLE